MAKFNKNTDLRELSYLETEAFMEEDPEAYEEASKRFDDRIISTHERYAANHPDFDQMWESGKIQKFMRENPGHNPISAHQMLIQSVLPAEEDPALQNTDQHGKIGVIANRVARSRAGKTFGG